MIYWFTCAPDQVVHFQYNRQQYQADHDALTGWIHEITSCRPGQFSMALDEHHCTYCNYRSLCNRGIKAGIFDDAALIDDPELKLSIAFDRISEVEF
jgi:hypothetical protein